jgi:2-keto-4-pentenoate hydratase/2-oxohepta-3-ene-1,7-dioic acid hydratase in catechol pathway
MRFVTYVDDGRPRAGVLDGDEIHPLEGTASITERLEASAERLLADGAQALDRSPSFALVDQRLLAPLQPPTIRDFTTFERHVEGMAMFEGASGVPDGFYDAPRFYFSSPHAVAGPDEDVPIPPGCERFDYELEVAAVIGVSARDLDVDRAQEVISGYTLFNDWSARDIGRREIMGKLGPAKAKDTTNALGPMLVTTDEIERYRNAEGFLDLELRATARRSAATRSRAPRGRWRSL